MTRMSAGGISIAELRIARACRVWIEATCTGWPGRGGNPAWMIPASIPASYSFSTVCLTISRDAR